MPKVREPGLGLSKPQAAFLRLNCTWQGFVAGRGSGKTHIGCEKLCELAEPDAPMQVISPDNNVIEDTTWPTFEAVARRRKLWIKGRTSPGRYRATIKTYSGGRTNVYFKGAEVPDKLRGPSRAVVWIDEGSVIAEAAYQILAGQLRWDGRDSVCLMTFTPKGRRHWTFGCFYEDVKREDADVYYSLVQLQGEREAQRQTGICKIAETLYRPRETSALIHCASWDNPFRPKSFVDILSRVNTGQLAEQEVAGKFVDLQGTMFLREWFIFTLSPRWRNPPRDGLRIRFWDLADTENDEACFTVGTLMCAGGPNGVGEDGPVWIEDVQRERYSAGARDNLIVQTALSDYSRYGGQCFQYVEQEPGSGGKYQADEIIRKLTMRGIPAFRAIPSGTRYRTHEGERVPGMAKIVRARPLSSAACNGYVYICNGPWVSDLVSELVAFPHCAVMDQVDSAASCYQQLRRHGQQWDGSVDIRPPTVDAMGRAAAAGIDLSGVRRRLTY